MSLRRLFLLGAAALATVAALVAIAAVLSGDFGETEGKIFATIGATFVAGSTLLSGAALLSRGVSRWVGVAGIVLAAGGYLLWAEQIWVGHDTHEYWQFLWIVLTWSLATLAISTNRLMLSSERLVRTLHRATAAAAVLAAAALTVIILRDQGDGWQLFAVLLILVLLGEILAPVLERYAAAEGPAERELGTVAGVTVVAVRGRSGTVRIGDSDLKLRGDEGVVVRAAD